MIAGDVAEVVVLDSASNRFHVAIALFRGEPRLHESCNFDGPREYLDDLPEDVEDSSLCRRCFGG